MSGNWNERSTRFMKRAALAAAVASAFCTPGLWAQSKTGYSGEAYGTEVSVAPGTTGITAGTTAVSTLCVEQTGQSNSNSTSAVLLPPLASTGVIDTSVASTALSGGSTSSTATAAANNLSLLGGLVTADAVQSVSSSISGTGGFSVSSAGTVFTNAKVLGLPILANVLPNTRIVLPGIGYVILNEQTSKVTSSSATMTVNAIHIKVSETNVLGLPVGTQLIVASAKSSTLFNEALLNGFAYGSTVNAGVIQSGRTAAVQLACTGTSKEVSNSAAAIDVPGVLTTGAVHTTAEGTIGTSSTTGQTTATVDAVDLLSNLVAATTITAEANVSASGGTVTLSDTGSAFAGLAVAGHPEVGANPPANTRVTISGLGTLWLHRVIETPTSIEVRMVELVVNVENSLGLPVGSDIQMSVAHVGVVQ